MSIANATKRPLEPVTNPVANLRRLSFTARQASASSLSVQAPLEMPLKTTLTELSDSRVRLDAEVPSEEVESRLQLAATQLGREIRIPGFRKGKVPGPMVIQRVGREVVLEQAVRDSLPEWYEEAILRSGVSTVGEPKLNLSDFPPAGEPLSFSIEISVTPKAKLGRYKGLEVGKREPEVPAEAIDHEVEHLRAGVARVQSVDRPAREGDFVLVDFLGKIDGEPFEGGEARDYMLELGGGQLVEGFEEQLVGARAGEMRMIEVDFPDDYRTEDLRGKHTLFEVEVKEVRERELPALDDDFARDVSEFETLAELRADIEQRLKAAQQSSIEDEFRQAAVDAAVAEAKLELPDELVAARAEEMWERTERALRAQNVDPETYLKASGRTREQVTEEAKANAARQLGRESVLHAVADAEGIEISDDELLEALGSAAEREGKQPEAVLERLRKTGRDEAIRQDIKLRRALDVLVEDAKPIDPEKAKAREKLWTPEKQKEGGSESGLWTPGEGGRDR